MDIYFSGKGDVIRCGEVDGRDGRWQAGAPSCRGGARGTDSSGRDPLREAAMGSRDL